MPKLPTLQWLPAPRGYAERLARWRDLWLIEQQIRTSEPEYAEPLPFAPRESQCEDPLWGRLASPIIADAEPEVGQIRLLAGWVVPKARRPVLVAVLYAWEGDVMVISPFGPFPEPATTSELLTGRSDAMLQVLSLWNTRTISSVNLKKSSRFVGHLSPQELTESRTVFRHSLAGDNMPELIWERVGSPIVNADDPRIVYQDEETQVMTLQLASDSLLDYQPHDLPLAAGSRDSAYELIDEWERHIEGSLCRLRFKESSLEISIAIIDPAGNPSLDFDRAELIGRDNRVLDTFDGPLATIRREDRSAIFAIRASGGKLLRLL
ncbi:MAG TPA: hypothetical protein VNW30_05290 [Opitutaceae bacterium]|jgi:hypothetical protein|nr:hypothetical protein [Opitutaceae bacterium]